MNAWQRWRASKGHPLRDRLVVSTPMGLLLAVAAGWNWMGGHVYRLDAFCRRCAWRRKHYGFKEYMRRVWNEED